ncbi:hypothetical protein Tco_0966956 [Tanacetum coccineum]
MAALQYKDDHNKIAYLGRERGCEDFTDILSYLDHSPLRYALTHAPPVVFDSLVKQFWATAVVRPNAAGSHDLVATIDGREVVVTESLIRTQLHFDDANAILTCPIVIFLRSGSWNQFPSSIATALICLSTDRVYNFSRFILEGMIGNVKATKNKFLMYPRFLQMIVAIETADRTPRPTFGFTRKLFANMKFRWEGQPMPLTPSMLAIAAVGDAANEENAAAHEAAGSTAEAHPEPHSPLASPVREPSPERQPETEWVVPHPVSPVTDWRPWPSVTAHSPIRDPTPEPASPPTPPAQTFIFEEPLVFGPPPRLARDVDPDVIESIIFGPQPRPHGYVDPDFVEPIIFGPQPRPDNYREPEDLDNPMEDDTTHGGFHVESPVRPDDAPTPTADAAGRAEDPTLLTSLSEKLDRCMGRIDSLETELGTTKKIMGGAILTLVSRVKKLEKTVKQLRTTRLVGDAPAAEGDVVIQDDVDIVGLSRMASAALGPDQTAVHSDDVEDFWRTQDEWIVSSWMLYPKSSVHVLDLTNGKTVYMFVDRVYPIRATLLERMLRHKLTVPPSYCRDVADVPIVSEQRAKELDELMLRMTENWLTLMMQVGTNPALARELLGADVTEDNFIERMTAIKERKKRALADLRYRALKGKPLKQSEVTQMMRNLVKNQWCAAHNGTITMTAVKAMTKQQLIEEYEYICKRLEKDRLLSAQYNLFRPKPAISEPPSKRQRVDRGTSPPSGVPAATTQPADDPDSAGGGTSHPAGSTFGAPVFDSTVPTPAAMDSAGSHHESGVSPFADSDDSSSPPNVSTDHIPLDVLLESTSGGINGFFLTSDAEEQIGLSRVAVDPDSDDDRCGGRGIAEFFFRGKYISGAGVVIVDQLPDDAIIDPRVKVETVSAYASSPPRSRRKHRGVRSDDFLWDKPVEDFFSSESESDDDMANYIPPLPYGGFKDWEIVSCPLRNISYHVYHQENRRQKCFTYLKELLPHVYREDLLLLRRRMNRYFRLNPDVDVGLDLWRDVNLLCQSLHSDDVEDFWRTQDEWIVSSWQLYPKSSVHVLDLMNGKTVYMFMDKVYPIRATLLERMLRHRLTVPPSYCRDVVVAGNIIQTVQDGLRQAYECLASAPIACTARQMVFSSPWLTAKKESGSPLQTALVTKKLDGIHFPCSCWMKNGSPSGYGLELASPEQTATGKDVSNPLYGCDGLPKTVRFMCFFGCAVLDAAAPVSAACIIAAGYIVSAGVYDAAVVPAGSSSSVPADYVSAGHVLVPADRDRIC